MDVARGLRLPSPGCDEVDLSKDVLEGGASLNEDARSFMPTSLPSFLLSMACAWSMMPSRYCISSSTASASSVLTLRSLLSAFATRSQAAIFSSIPLSLTFCTFQTSRGMKSLLVKYPPRGCAMVW